jgi:hypothetical protein
MRRYIVEIERAERTDVEQHVFATPAEAAAFLADEQLGAQDVEDTEATLAEGTPLDWEDDAGNRVRVAVPEEVIA